MVSKDAARNYHLGLTVGSLGNAYHRQTRPPEEFRLGLRELAETTGESTYFSSCARRDRGVASVRRKPRGARIGLQQGYAGAAHARASGKLLLAYLEPDELQRYSCQTHPLTPVTAAHAHL